MTAPLLLAYICGALLIQLAAGVGLAIWSSRRVARRGRDAAECHAVSVPVGAWPGWRAFRVARRDYEDAARTQCSFYLEPVDGMTLPAFRPGQFLTFKLTPSTATRSNSGDMPNIVRCYSLPDQPDPAQYRITIKRALRTVSRPDLAPGVASSAFHDTVQVGDVLQVKAPAGQFFVDPDPQIPVVLIAGGIGNTPMMSMLLWSLGACPGRDVYLYYGVLNGAEEAFKVVLEFLAQAHTNFHLTVVYEKPAADDKQGRDFHQIGYVSIDLVRRTLPHGRHHFYVCGPPAMMTSIITGLREWGIPSPDIRQEAFGPASVRASPALRSDPAASRVEKFEIKFARSGRTISWNGDDANLLDFAERHGVAVESGCRSGSCGTCETKLISGTVRYAQTPDIDIAAGSHALLPATTREKCASCHVAPKTAFHRDLTANCTKCHGTGRWKPATFDHAKFFVLDRNHNAECATCHVNNDTSKYTCYGCHEHQPDRIRSKHIREGIPNFENCVKCHRSGSERGEGGGEGGRGGRERN